MFGGQEFSKPLKHVPAKRFIKFCFNILRSRLPEVIVSDLFGPHPYYYSPLVTGSKIVRVEAVGTSMDASKNALREVQQHPLVHVGAPLHEDFRHHGGSRYEPHDGFGAYDPVAANAEALAAHAEANPSAAAAVTKTTKKSDAKALKAKKKDAKAVDKVHSKRNAICVDQRQKMFGNLESLAQHSYDPRMEYTFEYYDANFRASDMKADLGGVAKLDLGYAIGEQPVLIDSKLSNDALLVSNAIPVIYHSYFFSFNSFVFLSRCSPCAHDNNYTTFWHFLLSFCSSFCACLTVQWLRRQIRASTCTNLSCGTSDS